MSRRPAGSRELAGTAAGAGVAGLGGDHQRPARPGSAWNRQPRTSRNAPSSSSTLRNSWSVLCQAAIETAASATSASSNNRAGAGRSTGIHRSRSAAQRIVASSSSTFANNEGSHRASGRNAAADLQGVGQCEGVRNADRRPASEAPGAADIRPFKRSWGPGA